MKKIMYAGDTSLDTAACYLAGIMTYLDLSWEYVPSDVKMGDEFFDENFDLLILSDYPASNFDDSQLQRLAQMVCGGMSLLMIGGWESFNGFGNGYKGTAVEDILAIEMADGDDRVNCPGPCFIRKGSRHTITENLPFARDATLIGGYNRFTAKDGGNVLLWADSFYAKNTGRDFELTSKDQSPLLVISDYRGTKVGACAGDVAPHWVGPFVDWGDQRVTCRAPGCEQIEVGNWYVKFWENLLKWFLE